MAEAKRKRRWLSPARRRTLLQTLGVVVVVGLLLWGADALARTGAETLLERNIEDATGVEVRPEVEVQGIFFVPQVIRGAYSEVHVTTQGITSGPLRIDRLESQLFDVRVPFHDVLVRDVRRVGIGRSVENFDLTYPDLNAYFAATGRRLTLSPGRDGAVTLNGEVTVLNQKVPISADVTLWVEDDVLRISPQNLNAGSAALNSASRLLLRQRLTLTIPLGTLPFGHRLTGVQADEDGVHITSEGTGILLEP
jgi:hypothetical protein